MGRWYVTLRPIKRPALANESGESSGRSWPQALSQRSNDPSRFVAAGREGQLSEAEIACK